MLSFDKGLTLYQNDNKVDQLKLKALAEDRIKVVETLKFDFRRVENIMGKDKNSGSFSPLPRMFSKIFFFQGRYHIILTNPEQESI